MESAIRLVAYVLIAYTLVLWISAVIWTYRDVRNRTTDPSSQVIAVLLVAVFNLPGLIVYLVIRPQATMADAYERSLEAEAILHELQLTASSCQNCQRPIEEDFNICPHCRVVLREPCRTCGRSVRTSWAACPYCASDRVPARPMTASRDRDRDVASEGLQPPSRRTTTARTTTPGAATTASARPPTRDA